MFEMRKFQEFGIFVLLLLIETVRCDVVYSLVHREDPCVNLCDPSPSESSCCQRGCRFFNLVELRHGQEPNTIKGTKEACIASCSEAYVELQDRSSCNNGCELMAKQRGLDILSLFSLTISVEEKIDSNLWLMSPDNMPDNDILTDPGLRKELLPRWWDSDGFKLPQTYIKTVPMDAGTVDYGVPPDYSGETEQSSSIPGSDWLQCASRHTGIPHWLLASAIAAVALSAFWLCLSPEKTDVVSRELLIEKTFPQSKFTVYIPDTVPLHKKPPPKYVDVVANADTDTKA